MLTHTTYSLMLGVAIGIMLVLAADLVIRWREAPVGAEEIIHFRAQPQGAPDGAMPRIASADGWPYGDEVIHFDGSNVSPETEDQP